MKYIYHVMLVSGVQQSDSVVHIYIYTHFHILFNHRLQGIYLFICLSFGMKDLFSWGMETFSCSMLNLVP